MCLDIEMKLNPIHIHDSKRKHNPRLISDDNCYIQRYHFLEGLSCYWNGQEILISSVVKKIKKKYTPFSYRKDSIRAFSELFDRFKNSIIILSYSSNGYPDKSILLKLLNDVKGKDNGIVEIENHTYHFGTHKTDVIIERLKLGRGSAIKGPKRGRFLENEVEAVIKSVFGDSYDKNCNFIGLEGKQAKAEFAIPSKDDPEILFEVKAYGATGSKQTDVLGDIGKIKDAKKHNSERKNDQTFSSILEPTNH